MDLTNRTCDLRECSASLQQPQNSHQLLQGTGCRRELLLGVYVYVVLAAGACSARGWRVMAAFSSRVLAL